MQTKFFNEIISKPFPSDAVLYIFLSGLCTNSRKTENKDFSTKFSGNKHLWTGWNDSAIKGAVSRKCLAFFYPWIQSTWAPDKQAKMLLLKGSFSWRYSNVRKFDFAQCKSAWRHLFREYLRENEFFSKTIFARLSGTQVGWIHGFKNWQKSRDTATLKDKYIFFTTIWISS